MQTTGNYQGLFAGVVIVFVPTVIIYVLLSLSLIHIFSAKPRASASSPPKCTSPSG